MSLTPNEKSKAIRKLDEALSDTHLDKDEAYELLRKLDFNPDRIVDRHLSKIKKLQAQLHIERAKSERTTSNVFLRALEQMEKYRAKFHKDPKDLLRDAYKDKFAFAAFRKLDELSDEDALEMLEETELLKLIKQLQEGH